MEIQTALAARNARAAEGERVALRIGVSLGDVMVEGGDLYGHGVNVAARLQTLAEPGGICISGNVHEHVRDAPGMVLEELGDQILKNLDRPIRCFRLHPGGGAAVAHTTLETNAIPRLPDKPSIAVLPFENMSGDHEQEYFADGITEDIITAMSYVRWLFVIARNSSFVYKGRAVDVKQVARELGVRYVLEGSVRKVGNRVRITAQLVDAQSGAHHWAERYDRDLADIFALQDEITRSVAAAIEPRLLAAEGIRTLSRPSADLNAWGLVARAMSRFWRMTGPDVAAAIELLRDTVAHHPDYGPAHSMLAFCQVLTGHFGWLPSYEVPKSAVESARRAVELDDNDPWAYLALGYVACVARQTDEAAAHYRRAVELNPNFAAAYGFWGFTLGVRWPFGGSKRAYRAGNADEPTRSAELDLHGRPSGRSLPLRQVRASYRMGPQVHSAGTQYRFNASHSLRELGAVRTHRRGAGGSRTRPRNAARNLDRLGGAHGALHRSSDAAFLGRLEESRIDLTESAGLGRGLSFRWQLRSPIGHLSSSASDFGWSCRPTPPLPAPAPPSNQSAPSRPRALHLKEPARPRSARGSISARPLVHDPDKNLANTSAPLASCFATLGTRAGLRPGSARGAPGRAPQPPRAVFRRRRPAARWH